jgi:hypothetical protein
MRRPHLRGRGLALHHTQRVLRLAQLVAARLPLPCQVGQLRAGFLSLQSFGRQDTCLAFINH